MIVWRKHVLGIAARLIRAGALVLEILAEHDRTEIELREAQPKAERALTLKVKGVQISIGKRRIKDDPGPKQSVLPGFTALMLAAIATGAIGLVLGPISWAREKQPILSCWVIGLCAAGLLLQSLRN